MPERPRTYRRSRLPKADAQGRWRVVVGQGQDGRLARFQIGNRKTTSEAEALRRLQAIISLYDRQCHELGLDCWAGWVQCWAYKMSQAVPIVVHASPAANNNGGQAWEELMLVRQLQAWGVPLVVHDELPALGYAGLRQQIDKEIAQAVEAAMEDLRQRFGAQLVEDTQHATAMPSDASKAPLGTLHGTIDAYKKHLEQTGKRDGQNNLSPHVRKCLEWLDMLKEHHADHQLWQLDFNRVEAMVKQWRNRPATKRGNRCSTDHASQMIKQVFRFLHWLDKQSKYRWTMPRGADDIERKPHDLPEDDSKRTTAFRSTTKHTYTPEQLATIVQCTQDFGRAMIGVCVNCAFGASEVGRWSTKEYHLFAKHPHAAALGIKSDERDSWIVGRRPKTNIYGEHLLWEEVAAAVKPFLDGREVLPVTGSGKPWYRSHSRTPRVSFSSGGQTCLLTS